VDFRDKNALIILPVIMVTNLLIVSNLKLPQVQPHRLCQISQFPVKAFGSGCDSLFPKLC